MFFEFPPPPPPLSSQTDLTKKCLELGDSFPRKHYYDFDFLWRQYVNASQYCGSRTAIYAETKADESQHKNLLILPNVGRIFNSNLWPLVEERDSDKDHVSYGFGN